MPPVMPSTNSSGARRYGSGNTTPTAASNIRRVRHYPRTDVPARVYPDGSMSCLGRGALTGAGIHDGTRRRIQDMKLLVTGAAGFIGAAVAQRLLDRGETVVGIDNL